ncbi:MAG: molybdenum cofactor guanylyltransferase [Gemmatimonadaceae bacterium]
MTASRCVGVLLAGGAARRFRGMPKGLALVDGLRIADRALAALRGATERQIVVANDPRAARWFPGLQTVPDAEEGFGPLHGLRTALASAEGAPVLVVAWDMPFVTAALMSALRAEGERGAAAVVPVAGNPPRAEPLCAYYAAGALAACDVLIARGERRAAALYETLSGATTVRERDLEELGDPARLLFSVDTLDDLGMLGGRLPDGEDTARR